MASEHLRICLEMVDLSWAGEIGVGKGRSCCRRRVVGLSGWLVDYLPEHPEWMAERYPATWFRATVEVRAALA